MINNLLKYNIWTSGCQMNQSDSDRLSSEFQKFGMSELESHEEADIVVLNTCVVRQSAEDAATKMLRKLYKDKQETPDKLLVVMGCMVGPDASDLSQEFPYVDLWARPQQFDLIVDHTAVKYGLDVDGCLSNVVQNPGVNRYVSVVHGCDKFCTFCIIPYRRGRESSRTIKQLNSEISLYVDNGVKEITLLGQNIDSYGHDLRPRKDLADLLESIHEIDGLERIRFLTSHPNDMSNRIIRTVNDLPKVCNNINLPFQSGDDVVLSNMKRGYTRDQYVEKIREIKQEIPGVTLTTDLIVGFPGESRTQFENSVEILKFIKFDKVHAAAYSERSGTVASRKLPDTVEQREKKLRLREVNDIQQKIQSEKNKKFLGDTLDILVEGERRGRIFGRAKNDKIVYINDDDGKLCSNGQTVKVKINQTSSWSLEGVPLGTG